MKNNLLLGTNNKGKLREFIFYIKHFNLFSGHKIIDLSEFDMLVICDDSGFSVDKLNNYPGIKTAREAKKLGGEQRVVDLIFNKFENLSYIGASFFCSICVLGKKQKYIVSGSIPGFIIKDKRGDNGFGYDPYFIPKNNNKTFAEMNEKQKLLNSHRYEAFKELSNQILLDN